MVSALKLLRENKHTLCVLKSAEPKLRKALLKAVPPQVIETIAEIAHNILRGNVPLSEKQRKKIEPFKKVIRKIASNCVSCKKKRKLLIQKGGFLGVIISSLLASIVGELLHTAKT
jgi:hypothetical protein